MAFTKANGSRVIQSLMCARTSNLLKHFNRRHISSCHPPGVKKGFAKGEALRLLRTNSSENVFEDLIQNFNSRLGERSYPKNLLQRTGTPSKTTGEQTNLTFRYLIPPNSDELETSPHEKLAFNRATTRAQRNLKPSYITKRGRSIKYILLRIKLQNWLKYALGSRVGQSLRYTVKFNKVENMNRCNYYYIITDNDASFRFQNCDCMRMLQLRSMGSCRFAEKKNLTRCILNQLLL